MPARSWRVLTHCYAAQVKAVTEPAFFWSIIAPFFAKTLSRTSPVFLRKFNYPPYAQIPCSLN
jgi:hypothetical protein